MREPFWSDAGAQLYLGDAYEVLSEAPRGSADCIVTSPPYWGKRDYGMPQQCGLENTPDEYLDALRRVFQQAHRVLADDGTLWLNLGDSYATSIKGNGGTAASTLEGTHSPGSRFAAPTFRPDVPAKNLLGLPWRLAFTLQADGWILRNAIVWSKPNAMPESVQDRLSCRYELIFLFSKRERYYFDLDAIRQPCRKDSGRWPPVGGRQGPRGCVAASARRRRATPPGGKYTGDAAQFPRRHGVNMTATGRRHAAAHPNGRNPGDVWSISTRPFRGAHFAVFPIDIPLRAIAAGCRPGGVVLDPFAGAATTGVAARRLRRRFAGVELNQSYAAMAAARLREEAARDRGDAV